MAVVEPPSAVATPRPTRHRFRAVDRLLLAYAGVVAVVAAVRAPAVPGCWWILTAHLLIALLIVLVTRPGLGVVGRALRELYPLLLLVALYAALDVLNAGATRTHDALVQGWEQALFGMQPSRVWWMRYPSRFWSTVLHGAYLSYYLILSAPALWFAARRELLALRRFIFMVLAAFCVCYLFFIFLPVAGPYYMFPRPTGPFVDNPMARLVYDALASGSSYGAAFPSSHVAATVAAAIAAARGSRTLGLVLLVPATLLTVSVVYCQMHYAVDALAGLAIGGLAAWAAAGLERRGWLV